MREQTMPAVGLEEATIDAAEAMSEADERFLTAVEALLFAAHEPLPATTLSATNGHKGWSLDQVIQQLNHRLATGGHPMRVRKVAGGYQMHLLPEFAPLVDAHLVKTRTQRLSRAGLETLAIVAYRQPCSTPEIERVRGVACDGVLRNLLERNLVTIKGRSDAPGRPLLYVTTRDFLRYFGLDALSELPAEEELDALLAPKSGAQRDTIVPVPSGGAEDLAGLFGTLTLRRGPETGAETEKRRFVIEGVVGTPDGDGDGEHESEDLAEVLTPDATVESPKTSDTVEDEPTSPVNPGADDETTSPAEAVSTSDQSV